VERRSIYEEALQQSTQGMMATLTRWSVVGMVRSTHVLDIFVKLTPFANVLQVGYKKKEESGSSRVLETGFQTSGSSIQVFHICFLFFFILFLNMSLSLHS
jgi:hypothetical protein